MFRSYAWFAYALAGLSASVYLLTHHDAFLGSLAGSAAVVMFVIAVGTMVEDVQPVLKSIRLRYGSVTWETINKHMRGISPYPSAAPTESARMAVERIYPDGKTLNDEGRLAVFGTGTQAEVRASLGYMDGKTWFEEAPGGLLMAELIHQVESIQTGSARPWDQKHALDQRMNEYTIFARCFVRPDLMAAVMLIKAGKQHVWSQSTDVSLAHRVLSAELLDAVLQNVPADVLNDTFTIHDASDSPWMVLFERLEAKPSDYRKVLTRFVDAGANRINMLAWDHKEIPGQRVLEGVTKSLSKDMERLKAEREKRALIERANGGGTPEKAVDAITGTTVAELVEPQAREAVESTDVIETEVDAITGTTVAELVEPQAQEAVESTDVIETEVIETVAVETYASTEASGVARIAVDRIFPDGITLHDTAMDAVFRTGTVASVRASLGFEDGKTWFEQAPGGLVVAEMLHRSAAEGEDGEADWKRESRVNKLIEDYQFLATRFVRPDVLGATLLHQAGKLPLWSMVVDVMVAHRTLSETLLDVILMEVGAEHLNNGVASTRAWIVLFDRLVCDPDDYVDVLTRFAEAGARGVMSCAYGSRARPDWARLRAAAEIVSVREEAIVAAQEEARLLALANAYTPHEVETIALRGTADHIMAEAGIAPVARRRARL